MIQSTQSVVGIKPVDSGLVIGCQVDKFTCTWLVEHFIAWSHIYPGFMGKVSTLTHFPLTWGWEVYSFLDQAFEAFVYGIYSILTDSADTPELDASFDEAEAMPS